MEIQQLLTEKNIDFKIKGNDLIIRCLNPDHDDAHPSLRIDKDLGIFNCYSCGFSGNIYSYFNIYKNKTHKKALDIKNKLEKLYTKSIYIPAGAALFDREYRGISGETFVKFGAFTHDSFPHRLVFPLYNGLGKLQVFHARLLYSSVKEQKYYNKPAHSEMPLFPAFPEDRKTNSLILVEGIFDVLYLYDKGLKNVITCFGTAFGNVKNKRKQQENIKKLESYKLQGYTKLFLLFDGDKSGRSASSNLKKYIKDMFLVEELHLPDDSDPGNMNGQMIDELKAMI